LKDFHPSVGRAARQVVGRTRRRRSAEQTTRTPAAINELDWLAKTKRLAAKKRYFQPTAHLAKIEFRAGAHQVCGNEKAD